MSTPRPVLAIVTPWFPNKYEPLVGIFVAKQVEALRTEMDVRLIHVQMNCELPGWRLRDFLLRRKQTWTPVTGVEPDRVLYFPFRWIAKLWGPRLTLRLLAARIRRALQSLPARPEAVLAWISWPTACAAEHAARSLGMCPAVLECYGAFPEVARQSGVRERLLALYRGDAVKFTVSPLMTRVVRESLGTDFTVHETGCVIDEAFFTLPLHRAPGDKVRGVCVGAICTDKGQDFIIAAAQQMKQAGVENFEIVCAGMGPDLEAFRHMAVQAGVAHLVSFPGLVSEEEKLRLYGESDFFVTPTLRDTFGAVVAEAMAAGLPVVTTPNGASEWVVDADTGIHCQAADAASLAAALTQMLTTCRHFDRALIRERVRSLFATSAYVLRIRTALAI